MGKAHIIEKKGSRTERARDRSGNTGGFSRGKAEELERIARFPAPDPKGLKAPEMRPKKGNKNSYAFILVLEKALLSSL
jgi:hypothetical protein